MKRKNEKVKWVSLGDEVKNKIRQIWLDCNEFLIRAADARLNQE